MNFQFNPAQLSRDQRNSLIDVLGVVQNENVDELIISPVEFPNKFRVNLDNDVEMLIGWDTEKNIYAGLTTPERLEQDIESLASETIVQPETPDKPTEPESLLAENKVDPAAAEVPEPELVKSEVGQRVEALALALVKITKPFDVDRRCEIWIQFTRIFIKELWK